MSQPSTQSTTYDSSQLPSRGRGGIGKPTGTQNYSSQDVDELLSLIETILPIGHNEWERVQLMYFSLSFKFNNLKWQ